MERNAQPELSTYDVQIIATSQCTMWENPGTRLDTQ